MKPLTVEDAIDAIEAALFDRDDPGCGDTYTGDMIINEIGRIRLRKIIKATRAAAIATSGMKRG